MLECLLTIKNQGPHDLGLGEKQRLDKSKSDGSLRERRQTGYPLFFFFVFFCYLRVSLQIHSTVGDGEPGAPLHTSNFSRLSAQGGSHVAGCSRTQSFGRLAQKHSTDIRDETSSLHFPLQKIIQIFKKNRTWNALTETELKVLRWGRRISGRRIGSDPFLQLQPSPNTSPDVCFPQVRAKSEAGAHGCRPCWREPVSLPGRGWGRERLGGREGGEERCSAERGRER